MPYNGRPVAQGQQQFGYERNEFAQRRRSAHAQAAPCRQHDDADRMLGQAHLWCPAAWCILPTAHSTSIRRKMTSIYSALAGQVRSGKATSLATLVRSIG